MEQGWTLLAYPLFEQQLDRLTTSVLRAKTGNPRNWRGKASTKPYFQLQDVMLERLPRDPPAPNFAKATRWAKPTAIGSAPNPEATGSGCFFGLTAALG